MMLDTLKMMKNAFYFILVPNLFLFIANKSKPYKILDYWSRDILNFNFSEKGRGLVSSPHSVYDFSKKKMILMLHSIYWPNFIVWLPFFLEILGNMCIAIVCWPGCDIKKIWNWPHLFNQAVLIHGKKVKTKT